jgi:serine/threonine protein kinase
VVLIVSPLRVLCAQWSLGVTLFFMVKKALPFPKKEAHKYWAAIRNGDYDAFWREHADSPMVSDALRDLLSRIFVMEPAHRITLEQIAAHPWVVSTPLPRYDGAAACPSTVGDDPWCGVCVRARCVTVPSR